MGGGDCEFQAFEYVNLLDLIRVFFISNIEFVSFISNIDLF